MKIVKRIEGRVFIYFGIAFLFSINISFGQTDILKDLTEKSKYIVLVGIERVPNRTVIIGGGEAQRVINCKLIKQYKGKTIQDSTILFTYYFNDQEKVSSALMVNNQLILFISSFQTRGESTSYHFNFADLVDRYLGYVQYSMLLECDLKGIVDK